MDHGGSHRGDGGTNGALGHRGSDGPQNHWDAVSKAQISATDGEVDGRAMRTEFQSKVDGIATEGCTIKGSISVNIVLEGFGKAP